MEESYKRILIILGLAVAFSGFFKLGSKIIHSSPESNLKAGITDILATSTPFTKLTNLVTSPMTPGDITMSPSLAPSAKVTSPMTPGDITMSPSLAPSATSVPTPLPTAINPSKTPLSTKAPTPAPPNTPQTSMSPSVTPATTPTPGVPTVPPTVTPSPSPTGLAVVINEIAWMGTSASANDEWIELYNNTASAVDLNGWKLQSTTGSNPDPVINLAGLIEPFGYFLLERTDDTTISDIAASQLYTGALNNACESLELRDNGGNVRDFVDCAGSWYAGDNTAKSTMERVDLAQPGASQSNWASNNGFVVNGHDGSGNAIRGTPKSRNSANQ